MNNKKNKEKPNHLCDKEVKDIVKAFHRKCSDKRSYKQCIMIGGNEMNTWMLGRIGKQPFDPKKKYRICANLQRLLLNVSVKQPVILCNIVEEVELDSSYCFPINSTTPSPTLPNTNSNHASTEQNQTIVPSPILLNREQRMFMRNRIPVKDMKGLKSMKVIYNTDKEETIDLTSDKYKPSRKSTTDVFYEDVCSPSNFCKVPFGNLSMRGKRNRMSDIGKTVIAACIDRSEYRNRPNDYLTKNESVAVDAINLLDGIKEYIEMKMKLDFNTLDDVAMAPVDNDTEGLITNLDWDNTAHKLAMILLGSQSRTSYHKLRSSMKKIDKDMPTYYMITKDRPDVEEVVYDLDNSIYENECPPVIVEDEDDTDGNSSVLARGSAQSMSEEAELERALVESSKDKLKMLGSKISGGYSKHIDLMMTKHNNKGREKKPDELFIVLDSFDGAEYVRSKKKITSIISFSSSINCGSWIESHAVTAGSSKNILTWQQLVGT